MSRFNNRWYYLVITFFSTALAIYFLRKDNDVSDDRIPAIVDYNFHIRPILSDRCFKCHGPDANHRKAELRLDTEEGLYKALKDDPDAHVIVAGKANKSELFLRVSAEDTSMVMPPPNSNLSLTLREIKLIEKWIDQGAKYQKHWAFIRPKKSALPDVDKDWTKNEIDYFVL